jgi:hypothetical protein
MEKFKQLVIFGCMVAMSIGCSKQSDVKTGNLNDLSPFAKTFLGLNTSAAATMSSSNAIGPNSPSTPAPGSYLSISGQPKVRSDSTVVTYPGQGCGTTTQTYHPDGSITVVMDLGDSCTQNYNDSQYTVWGTSTYTSKNTVASNGSIYNSNYYYRNVYVNLGSRFIYQMDTSLSIANGHSTSVGSSTYDTITQKFSASSSWGDTSDYSYGKTNYSYVSDGKSIYSGTQSIVESNVYSYLNGTNSYQSVVTVPIVRDYSCHVSSSNGYGPIGIAYVSVPISGHEIVKYSQDGTEGTFEIDYGNGTCDTLITIYENGKVIVINMNDLMVAAGG